MVASDFFSPRTYQPLAVATENDVTWLEAPDGERYRMIGGIPELLLNPGGQPTGFGNQEYYRTRAAEYDRGNDVMYRMLLADENEARAELIGLLGITPGARVLEVGCGTCRDTIHLLNSGALVYASDLSAEMIMIGRVRLQTAPVDFSRLRLFIADAMHLPFPDGFFDAAFHFGGLNLFPDIGAGLAELSRVVKVGGRVVAGDEGVGSWLSQTNFAKILENSNPLFRHRAPLEKIPVDARNVACRWVLNGSFYVISFEVGSGEPQLDLDVQFPGWRGGSHRSRYYGKLEGVAPELRDKLVREAASEGVSVVTWLERTIQKALEGKT